jgi:predicted transcriptional regulator
MVIKLQDLRYIRRTPGEIAVLRELVSLQRCKVINPSELWLAQMTNLSESSVRRALVNLAKSGFISYDRHKEDFRGPNRPTNTYTLHPDRIQEAIGAGKVAVSKALGAYYRSAGTPHHSRKAPVRLTGETTGQVDPQDVSLSKEQRQDESLTEEFNLKCDQYYEEFSSSFDDNLQYINNIEELEFKPFQEDFHMYKEDQGLSTEIVPIPTPSPISAPPPSPPLPEPPPVFVKVGRTIFRMGEGGAPMMIPYDGELPPGAIVHQGKVLDGY